MVESKDKGMPLMKPTFFEKNDPNNPKYNVIEDKNKSDIKKMVKRIKDKISSRK